MAQRLLSCLLLSLGGALAPGCTYLLYEDLEAAPVACNTVEDCFAGQDCVDAVCTDVEPATSPPAPPGATVGPAGGTLTGPAGVRLIVPPGAVDEVTQLSLGRASTSLLPGAFTEVSVAIELTPAVSFAQDATLEVDVDESDCDDTPCRVYRRTADGAWVARPAPADAPSDATTIRGAVAGDGVFMVGAGIVDAGPPPEDAGPSDAGGIDAGSEDAGVDAGVPAPTFATCDLTPDSCDGGEVCWPDPFTGLGVCLRESQGAGDSGCACAGRLPGATSDLCLPASLCGAGAVGATCASGTADCDAATTTGCTDLGDGAVCTASCETSSDCGGGCCVPNPGGSGGLCKASGACGADTNGAACIDDDSCASGTCAALEGLADPVCTDTCTPGGTSCGAGSCCYPTNCAGDGLCVDESVCEATDTLLCDDLCVSDAACGAGTCVNGGCQ